MTKKNNWSASGYGRGVTPDLIPDELLEEEVVLLLQGNNLFGDQVYSYLKVTGKNLKEMFAAIETGKNFKPSDFGAVVQAGRGEPTREVIDEMNKTYNMLEVPNASVPVAASIAQPKFFGDDEA